jgi:DUF4097 and DUF4098 domain-containing protein YvlB
MNRTPFVMTLRAAFLCGALLTAGAVAAATPIDERQPAPADGSVFVSNISGEIIITGWNRDEVEVTGTLGKNVERLDFTREGDLTVIEVIYPKDGRNSEGSNITVHVPEGSQLEVKSVSADVAVSGVTGRQRLRSVSGDVTTEVFAADVEADSVSGNVIVGGRDEMSHASLTTVSGRIETRAVSGELEASTVSGRIDARGRMLGWARLKTTSGRITLDGGLADGGRFDIGTTSGDVELTLDNDKNLDVDAQTFSGDLDNCFGVDSSKARYSPERSLRIETGEASRTVRIRAMSGDIEICSAERDS